MERGWGIWMPLLNGAGMGDLNAPAKLSTPTPMRFTSSVQLQNLCFTQSYNKGYDGPSFWPQAVICNKNAQNPAFFT